MKTKRAMSRFALARRLHEMALRIAAGKPIRIGGVSIQLPNRVNLEEEVETKAGETEIEIEIKWQRVVDRLSRKSAGLSSRRRGSGSAS
jgi:amphi-Trp domain-containing protein